ncbi:MAG: hypothetical protein J5944_10800 [Lentisphaeria bacterium]|nr:hypothetical protein [Lentisphaeria bacterium]
MKTRILPILIVFMLATALLCRGQVIFRENFENGTDSFKGLATDTVNPGEGKACALLQPENPASSEIADATGTVLIPVKPETWYRISFLFRNTIGHGKLTYGFRESVSATEMKSGWYSFQQRALPLNIDSWNRYTGEFKTAKGTKAIRLSFHTENKLSGVSWLDDLTVEEFTPVIPPLAVKPFDAAASYTDIPTMQAYVEDPNLPALKRTTFWRELDLKNMPLTVVYHELPPETVVKAELLRGEKAVFTEERTLTGSGETTFDIGLANLSEGLYKFRVRSVSKGETTCVQEKEIWRIRQEPIRMTALEPIQRVSIGPDRSILVNGKPFRYVYASTFPCSGLLGSEKANAKPDLETYMKIAQEQFGFNHVKIWYYRSPKWDDKLAESDANGVAYLSAWLDFLQKNNYCGCAVFEECSTKRLLPRLEWIRALATGIGKHPALSCFYLDEPEIPKYTPEQIRERYRLFKELAPDRMVQVNLCHAHRFKDYAGCSDYATFDVYPFPSMSLLESEDRIRKLLKAAPKDAPFFEYLQMFNFKDLEMPTFDQVRATFVLDRIYGSHALISYVWGADGFQRDMELQAYFRTIYMMFMKLEDFMETGTRMEWPVRASTPHVRSCAFRNGDQTAVLVVNLSNETPAGVTFDTAAGSASDFFDGAWTYPVKGGRIKLNLKPNGTAVLRLTAGGQPAPQAD